jgi:hypothetical protein
MKEEIHILARLREEGRKKEDLILGKRTISFEREDALFNAH